MRSMKLDQDGDTIVVVFLDGNISDEVRIMEIGDDLTEIASKLPSGHSLVLNFQNVEYLSSAMVGRLVSLRKATQKNGVELRLRHVSSVIQDILRIMHLEELFPVEDSDGNSPGADGACP